VNIVGKPQRYPVNEKTAQLNRKFFYIILIVFLCFFLDRISKIYIIQLFIDNDFKDYFVNEYLNFTLTWNKGIAFGLLESKNLFYHFISFVIFLIISFIFYLIYKTDKKLEFFSFSIIAGGAIGNLFDRLYYQAVPDFLDIHYQNFHWFTFNVSDIFITIGIIMLLIFDIFKFNIKDNETTN